MKDMGRALLFAMLAVAAPIAIAGQVVPVLHIRAVLTDATGRTSPVARHALLISENPQTTETRRVVTGLDGTATVRLSPGNYTVESDQPLVFQGQPYYWRQTIDMVAGRDSSLDLTLANALSAPSQPGVTLADTPLAIDTTRLRRQWLDSVVEVWTPTAHASGFLVDAAGLIATNQRVVGDATSVEVQLSRSSKVAGSVVAADRDRDIALIRVDPSIVASLTPVPLGCPRSGTPVANGQEIFALAAPLRQEKSWTPGGVIRVDTQAIASDLRLAPGGTGGPVFTASGDVVGLTSLQNERDEPRRGAVRVVRIDAACQLVAVAAQKLKDAPAPSAARLPVEPSEPAPIAAFADAVKRRAGSLKPYQLAASDFDVTFITPILNFAAQSQSNLSFSNWSEYVEDIPPVLLVRVTPKMAESFWAKLARGAAYTQGMALPPLKRLQSGFHRMQVLCGRMEVTPIHPFKLELRISETDAVYEGLYVLDPAALGPHCGTATLVLYSEKEPARADTRVIDPRTLEQIRRDFDLHERR